MPRVSAIRSIALRETASPPWMPRFVSRRFAVRFEAHVCLKSGEESFQKNFSSYCFRRVSLFRTELSLFLFPDQVFPLSFSSFFFFKEIEWLQKAPIFNDWVRTLTLYCCIFGLFSPPSRGTIRDLKKGRKVGANVVIFKWMILFGKEYGYVLITDLMKRVNRILLYFYKRRQTTRNVFTRTLPLN